MSEKIYLVSKGAIVRCSNGSETATLIGTSNTRIGVTNNVLESDTGEECFEGKFGKCSNLGRSCERECSEEKWLNVSLKIKMVGSNTLEDSVVTTASFLHCNVGDGYIFIDTHGQDSEPFD